MKQLNVAAVVITQGASYIMQHRTGDPGIGAAGRIGFFGGKIENETAEMAARREIAEETTLVLPDNQPLEWLYEVVVASDYKNEPISINMTFFGFELPSFETIQAKEGRMVVMTKQEAVAQPGRLTPATRAYFEKITQKEEQNV
jgi:8-oxo-dGTP pyrophosphatase MutT (NUDIX family)